MDSTIARQQVELLKQTFLRLKGWDKSQDNYRELLHDLLNMPEYKGKAEWKNMAKTDQWNTKEAPSETLGKFTPPPDWEFASKQSISGNGESRGLVPRRSGMGMKRATSNWGMGAILRFLNGEHDHEHEHEEQMNGNRNGNGVKRSVETENSMLLGEGMETRAYG